MAEIVLQTNSETTPAHGQRHLRHIRELDGLRGIAAGVVFFHHVCFTSITSQGWSTPIRWLRDASIGGMYGVDLFFVLSGYLITTVLLEARGSDAYYPDFYWKRALRILPLYVLCLIGVGLFMRGSGGYVAMSALFVANFAHLLHVSSDGPFWTLAIEEQFYLIWPSIVRHRSVAQLRKCALILAGATIVLRLVAACFGHHNYWFTFFRCDGLAGGAFLACWIYRRDASVKHSTREDRLLTMSILLGSLLIATGQFLIFRHGILAFGDAFTQTGVTFLATGIVAFLITRSGRPSVALLRTPVLTFFGLISYAFYMTHLYVMYFYDHLHGRLVAGDIHAYWIRFFTILGSTVLLCLISRYAIELPAMSLRRFVLSKNDKQNSISSPVHAIHRD